MAWKAIPGFLLKDVWFPFEKTHIVKHPVAVPAKACENLCATTKDCCHWGVAQVKTWEDAADADKGFTTLGWEVHSADLATFKEATWCVTKECAEAGAVKLAITVDGDKVLIHHKGAEVAKLEVASFPGKDAGDKIYILVILTEAGWAFFDKDGKKVGGTPEVDALKNLKEDPADHNEVTFVKGYSCGLFKKETNVAKIRLEAVESGFLKKCDSPGHESIVDGDKAFAAALAKAKVAKWSVDASAGSHGISFASIVCAVFSSVALVFAVLFVAKKNSQLEVVVADE